MKDLGFAPLTPIPAEANRMLEFEIEINQFFFTKYKNTKNMFVFFLCWLSFVFGEHTGGGGIYRGLISEKVKLTSIIFNIKYCYYYLPCTIIL